ncbi:MAG: hypothetical protein Q9217_006835, partial [Psora testacea]
FEGLQSVASTVFAGQHMATFARQDVLAMSRATHLADLAAARSFKFSELATVVALMVPRAMVPLCQQSAELFD